MGLRRIATMSEYGASPIRPAMVLPDLLKQAGLETAEPVPRTFVRGVADDSRDACSYGVFVAVAGHEADGHNYIDDALARGVSAVVVERPVESVSGAAVVRVPDTRVAAARLASSFYGIDELQAEGTLRVVAVTGTNGKSTFCYLTRSVARAAECPCALLGTIEYDLLGRRIPARVTTPGPVELARYACEAATAGAKMLVLEASSHALHQRRTDGLHVNVAVFTNLSGDHQDYHGSLEEYLAAKKLLFDRLDADATAVLNLDDPASEQIAADSRARRLTYGLNQLADVRAKITEMTAVGSRFELITPDGTAEVRSLLVGRHNVMNSLAAASTGLAMGFDLESIARGLSEVPSVAGRLESVVADDSNSRPTVLVDYAHTDDALLNVLSSLAPLKQGQLIVVFGCGGDRDRSKRPRMARAAAAHADRIVVTSDNPRTESPEAIIEEILAGFEPKDMQKVTIEPDRKRAIERAIRRAEPDDIVLIAGKGHETYQILGKQRVPFDDRQVALACLTARDEAE